MEHKYVIWSNSNNDDENAHVEAWEVGDAEDKGKDYDGDRYAHKDVKHAHCRQKETAKVPGHVDEADQEHKAHVFLVSVYDFVGLLVSVSPGEGDYFQVMRLKTLTLFVSHLSQRCSLGGQHVIFVGVTLELLPKAKRSSADNWVKHIVSCFKNYCKELRCWVHNRKVFV